MKNAILLLCALVATTSCVDLKGDFRVFEPMKLVHTTVFGNQKTKTVNPGTYRTKVSFSSSEKVKITFDKGDDSTSVKIKLPSRTSFPRDNGRINLPASMTGQRYDITGAIRTDISYSRTYRDRETCTYTVYEQRCTRVCDNNGNCRRTCDRVPVTRSGWQHVEYRYTYTDRDLRLEVSKPNSAAIVGRYDGSDRDTSKTYLHQGRCF